MRHSCGACGGGYACNGGVGSDCNCGHHALPRLARRCPECNQAFVRRQEELRQAEERIRAIQAQQPQYFFIDPGVPPGGPPPPMMREGIDWNSIPRAERCNCNKCHRAAQEAGIAL